MTDAELLDTLAAHRAAYHRAKAGEDRDAFAAAADAYAATIRQLHERGLALTVGGQLVGVERGIAGAPIAAQPGSAAAAA